MKIHLEPRIDKPVYIATVVELAWWERLMGWRRAQTFQVCDYGLDGWWYADPIGDPLPPHLARAVERAAREVDHGVDDLKRLCNRVRRRLG